MKTELNLMKSIYGAESAAPCGACFAGILHSRGCAPHCGASPRAIAPAAPPAQKVNGNGRDASGPKIELLGSQADTPSRASQTHKRELSASAFLDQPFIERPSALAVPLGAGSASSARRLNRA